MNSFVLKKKRFFLVVLFSLFSFYVHDAFAEKPEKSSPPASQVQPPPRMRDLPPKTSPPSHVPSNRSPHPPPPHTSTGESVPFMEKLQGYKARLEKDPKDVEALIFIANANFDIQRFEKAEKLYLRVLDVNPDDIHVQTDLASTYRNLGAAEKAVQMLKKVLDANPNHEVALYNLGIILLNDQNDPKGAADAWERLVSINPGDPLAEALRDKIKTIRAGKLKPE
ncbi:MAG: tetratricopeptide repeat protein [Nitrospiria bacterium]